MNQPPDTAPLPPIPPEALEAWAAWEEGFTRDHAPCGVCAPSPWVHGAQPPPRLTAASQPVWPALEAELGRWPKSIVSDAHLAYLAQRAAQGKAKYGVLLSTHDGRDPWQDAQEEIADFVFYLCRLRLIGCLTGREYVQMLTKAFAIWDVLDAAKARQEGANP